MAAEHKKDDRGWLELAFEGAEVGLWEWNVQTGAVDFSGPWTEITGYGAGEVDREVGTLEGLVHPDDLPRVLQARQDHLDGRTPWFEVEYRMAAKGGDWRWMLCRGRVCARDGGGRAVRLAGTQIDITGLRRAQAELARLHREKARESEEQFRILFDRSPDGILVVDAGDERILKANRACQALLGCSAEELVGRRLPLLEAEDAPGPEDLVARAAAQGASAGLATLGRCDGPSVRVGFNATAFPWGAVTAVLVTLRDVSERMRAEEERRRLEATLRNVAAEWARTFDAIPIGIVLVDAQGCVRRLNDAARVMASRPDFVGLAGTPLLGLADGEPWVTAAAVAAVTAEVGSARRPVADPGSGRSWAVSASGLPRPQPEAPWTIVTLEETTQQVAMQDALRRSESMAALGELVAGVAHEVRSPLFAMAATIELLEGEDGPAIQREDVAVLREAVARLTALMEDLIDYGRPQVEPRVKASLETAVYTAIRECSPLARSAGVTMTSRCQGVVPVVEMDERAVVRALRNVVQNAIQHSPPGGVVEVELKADGHASVCSVRDGGGGFAPEDLRRAFTPFFSRRAGGTGLGLALVRRVVEEHGGQVRAQNHPQGGALVTIRLPGAAAPGGRAG